MNRRAALIALLLVASLVAVAQNAYANETVSLCIPHVATAGGERIVGFEIALTGGMVRSVSNLPLGWYLELDNDPSWHTTIKGNIRVGAAALDSKELRKLRITIQKDTTLSKFAVSGKVALTTDSEKTRNIVLAADDFEVSAAK